MNAYPLLFRPILKEKVWGGRRLAALGKPLPEGALVGESWELADLPDPVPDGQSVIANGPLAGRPLRELLDSDREAILGPLPLSAEGGFPLLVKYLDARENLSVQVHPDEAYVQRHPETHLKSEAWVVVDAEPGAVIYKGLRPEVTRESFRRDIDENRVADDLLAVPVERGACHYLPSGTCHALGAGVMVAEVQTPSDTTFRVYDWGRRDRELHVEQALECIRFGETPEVPGPQEAVRVGELLTTPLVRTSFFAIERIEAGGATSLPVVTSGEPVVWMTLAGAGRIETPGGPTVPLAAGTTVLMPAALESAVSHLEAGTILLRVTLPSPLEGLIA
jgi:mannose-6-phosphate isomerase